MELHWLVYRETDGQQYYRLSCLLSAPSSSVGLSRDFIVPSPTDALLGSPYVISDGSVFQQPVRVPLADRNFSLATFRQLATLQFAL